MRYFYPRPPRGGRRVRLPRGVERVQFLSTPSARRATARETRTHTQLRYFYPRPPRGGRPWPWWIRFTMQSYFYPRPPRGGRLINSRLVCARHSISIHALREEGDYLEKVGEVDTYEISIHALREEGDTKKRLQAQRRNDFYPRPPRGGRRHRSRKSKGD